jgi:hypothetical protein
MLISGPIWKAQVLGAVIAIWTIGVPVAAGQSGSSEELEPVNRATEHFLTVFQNFDLGEPPNPRRGRRTLVFVKERDGWKLAHLHASAAGSP